MKYFAFNLHFSVQKMVSMLLLILLAGLMACTQEQEQRKPNVVIIFLDDSGWADFEPFGELALKTPSVQQLAEEGSSFHNFYVPQAVCSASRSALLTGCFPGRTGVFGAHGPNAWGLDTAFATMGEVFSEAGYATAAFGKWHCGDQPETRSHARGFDETCGLMYSNDMWKHHPGNPEYWGQWPLQFWENGKVTIEEVDHEHQENLTRWYTEHAVDFIRRHQDSAFFLYVPHSMPHVPLYTSKDFEGKSGKGIYWDVMLEIDWSVGEINRTLKECGIDQNTIIILTSDNGPWVSYGDHAGLTPFREAKGTSFDGGVRSACIMKYPGFIPAGAVSTHALGTVNLMPTLCQMAKIPLPDNEIDGVSVWDLVCDLEGAKNQQDYYAFSNGRNFEGVMSGDGRWKLHLPHAYRSLLEPGADGFPGSYEMRTIDTALFDMETDPYETNDVRDQYPDVASDLIQIAEKHKARFYSN
jgi:arylsulfatase A-like enzyme